MQDLVHNLIGEVRRVSHSELPRLWLCGGRLDDPFSEGSSEIAEGRVLLRCFVVGPALVGLGATVLARISERGGFNF